MPKIDGTHISARLKKRIAELEAAEEVAKRDIKVLLNVTQRQALDAAWAAQEQLRNGKRARTKEEEVTLGWKTKRAVRIEAFKAALAEAEENELNALKKKLRNAEVRQARIYFNALNEAEKAGKDKQTAKNWANNELTRAGLKRLDGQIVGYQTERDKEVFDMEETLRESVKKQMTADEFEQVELSKKHDKNANSRIGKARKQ